ncbi:hypothetical protein PO909_023200 [Leuciscus waleckii]
MATTTARVTPGTHNPPISAQTVRNRLREAGLRACRPVVRQVLTRHHQQQRRYGHKPTFAGPDRSGKKCSSLMSHGFVSPGVMDGFVFIVEGMSVTPRPVPWSRIDLEGRHPPPSCGTLYACYPDMILQQDNATSHTARSVREFLHDSNVSVLPWPAKSPDLNPIEHVWDLLDRRVRARAIPPRNVQELASALVEEWCNISQQELTNLSKFEALLQMPRIGGDRHILCASCLGRDHAEAVLAKDGCPECDEMDLPTLRARLADFADDDPASRSLFLCLSRAKLRCTQKMSERTVTSNVQRPRLALFTFKKATPPSRPICASRRALSNSLHDLDQCSSTLLLKDPQHCTFSLSP